MVWRSAHAVVVQPVERPSADRTIAKRIGELNRRHLSFEAPYERPLPLDEAALKLIRSVEMRARRRETLAAEETTHRRSLRGTVGIDGE